MSETKAKYWSKLIAEQKTSGQDIRSFCHERRLGEASFYYWRKRLRRSDTVRFALLETRPVESGTASALELVLRSGERLRIGNEVDAGTLRMVLEAVRG